MKFKLWLEGKAISVSSDMEKFAQEVVAKINQGNWEYGDTIHERLVKDDKHDRRYIKIVIRQGRPGRAYASIDAKTLGSYPSGEIEISPDKNKRYGDLFEDLLVHEIIHLFDPKISFPSLASKKWNINAKAAAGYPIVSTDDPEQDAKYYSSPWEQDAYMRQLAREKIRDNQWLFDSDWESIKDNLRKVKPEMDMEKAWYGNPKMWRKYLNTIYDELSRRNL